MQGLVKLADFGVAAKLGELEEQHCDELHQNVVGTPYWMAPEASVPHTNTMQLQLLWGSMGASHVSPSRQRSRATRCSQGPEWLCFSVSSGSL